MDDLVNHVIGEEVDDTCHYDWNTHQPEKPPTLFVVLFRYFYGPSGEPIHVLDGTRLLCLLTFLLRFFSFFETFGQLGKRLLLEHKYCDGMSTHHSLFQLGWFPIKDVGWFNPILDYAYCPVKETH